MAWRFNWGIEPLLIFRQDKNRSQIESQLYALDRAGLNNSWYERD
jgi:hypothetical protein